MLPCPSIHAVSNQYLNLSGNFLLVLLIIHLLKYKESKLIFSLKQIKIEYSYAQYLFIVYCRTLIMVWFKSAESFLIFC